MLDETDSDRVKRWLAAQMQRAADKGDAPGLKAKLAEACHVSPQAVSGWLRTGRITKTNLARVERFFNAKADFINRNDHQAEGDDLVRYSVVQVRWPFPTVSLDRLQQLPPDDLLRLEGALLLAAAQLGIDLKVDAAA